jgi:hypothetical protein
VLVTKVRMETPWTGYATEPQLMLAQELMRGGSLEKQLYVESWAPTHAQACKVCSHSAGPLSLLMLLITVRSQNAPLN